jgi:glycerol-1-phosphate dehydrogenase [NAD(P)+]
VAVGSGTINDLVKLSAHHCGRPYMSVATAASMDGYTAFGASITKDGYKQTMTCPAPTAVVADIDVIGNAPDGMNASGYADLIAKIPAGADWIVADALGIEPLHQDAWPLVQHDLRVQIDNPSVIRNGDQNALMMLVEGLIMSGLAMQVSQSSRPASGAEHQFSHLWDMENDAHGPSAPSHGMKVGIGSICSEALYEQVLRLTPEEIRSASPRVGNWWPDWPKVEAAIRAEFKGSSVVDEIVEQSKAKYVDAESLAKRLSLLHSVWPELRDKLSAQLLGARKMQAMIARAGAPSTPEEIGIDCARLAGSYRRARMFRKRYTVLDLALECGIWQRSMDSLFGTGGFWSQERPKE